MSAPTAAPPVVLSHRFADELPELALPWQAQEAPDPSLLVLDDALAAELGLDPAWLRSRQGVQLLVGGHVPEGARPVAQAYAGHQFGSYSPRLGDGRALLLGEIARPDGELRDLHLKGSGRTPFARAGDGLAAVGPMLREHVLSTAMHALGVPTTRALAVVATGRGVQREQVLPGAVLTRVARSHLRVGSFQYARAHCGATGDLGLLRRLAEVAIARHHPGAAEAERPQDRYRALLDAVVAVQAELVARWMLLGFVHGVMNTDNVTISGETIDYGPCAFIDAYDPAASFSSIDVGGRYAFGQQPGIAEWDLARFAEALLPLLAEDPEDVDRGVAVAQTCLAGFRRRFAEAWSAGMRRKLGVEQADDALVEDLLELLRAGRVDHTSTYRRLADLARGGSGPRDLFLDRPGFDAWAQRWLALGPDPDAMDAANPVYVPRNHLVEEALTAATAGDLAPLERLLAVVADPFREQPGAQRYAEPAPEDFGAYTTFCGT